MFYQMYTSNKGRIHAITFLTILALVVSACQSILPGQASIPEVVITSSEYIFENPAEIEAGLTSIQLENKGEELHHAQLVRLNDGVSVDEFQAAMQAEDEQLMLRLVTLTGGVGLLPPGGSGSVLMDLKEGQYILLDFIPDAQGVPNLAKGMVSPMRVNASESTEAAQAPSADAEIVLKDFNMVLPDEISAGSQTWQINNEGPQPHEIILLKLVDNMTMDDVQKWGVTMEGPPPFEPVGGMQGLSAGGSGYLELDLSPGSYIASCDIPDPVSGKPHSELGMLMEFEVQ